MLMTLNHLDMGDDGYVILKSLPGAELFDFVSCGWIGTAHWPATLGYEPEWFGPEIERMREWWGEERRLEDAEAATERALLFAGYDADCIGNP